MIIQVDVDINSSKADEVEKLLNNNGYKVRGYWNDEILMTSCPNCGETDCWDMYDKCCGHCGFSC